MYQSFNFDWVNNDMRLMRRQRRVNVTRYRSTKLGKQAISKLEGKINNLSVEEIKYRIRKMKKKSKIKRLSKYNEIIHCNNEGCSECSV